MGKKVECASDSEATEYNHKACKASAGSVKKSQSMETDYSIPGKKRGTYKQDGD